MPQLALYTFGTLKAPMNDPEERLTREFYANGAEVYQDFHEHPGFIDQALPADPSQGTLFDYDWGDWGEFTVPTWYGKGRSAGNVSLIATLSRWTDLRSAFDSVYGGPHRAALKRRYDWFEKTAHPGYVLWWVTDGKIPTWREGVAKLEHLHQKGYAPDFFTFKDAFDPDGKLTSL
ncbi:DUF3291 domain-containing protein [Streptomyces niveus]|uniref:DUF3291 domain-containing protein n=1 Tax=Streptomyces niveus TaxID=193462 RepID=UPI003422116E